MANNFDAYNPEHWANATVAQLYENMVFLGLVHRDFEPLFNKFGDVVNTRQPAKLTSVRKAKASDIAMQDVSATNIAVPLDQHIYTSMNIGDIDQNYSFKDLMAEFIEPAGMALAKTANQVVAGSMISNLLAADRVTGLASQTVYENIVDTRTYLDTSLAYEEGRNLVATPGVQNSMLKDSNLYRADAAGSDVVVKKGLLGNLANFNLYKDQILTNLSPAAAGVSGTGDLTIAAATAGATSLVTTATTLNGSYAIAAGQFLAVNGVPYRITAVSGSGPYTITIHRGLATAASAGVIKAYGVSTAAASYAAGYGEALTISVGSGGFSVATVGQIVRIGTAFYQVISVPTATTIYLDRPLDAAVSSSDPIAPVARGNYSVAFHRNAMTAAIRPLAPVQDGIGARSAVSNFRNLSVRATIGYNMTKQHKQVTLDFLMGTKMLDTNLAAVMVS